MAYKRSTALEPLIILIIENFTFKEKNKKV